MRTNDISLHIAKSLLLALLLTSCSSNIPLQIRQTTASNITPAEARQKADAFAGQSVRWGGEIISIENKPDYTQLTVLAKPLDDDGSPQTSTSHQGRFIAQINRFLEPSLYAAGRQITVVGTFTQILTRMIGEYPYQHPVVMVDTFHLWPVPLEPEPDYWYDPWYPWGPWHHYPYTHHPAKARSTTK